MAKKKTHLLIIDPQWDFCNPGNDPNNFMDPDRGSLYVSGAEKDMERVAHMVRSMGKQIDQIHITLDCHYYYDIAHNVTWRDSEGNTLPPFTIVTHKDVVEGRMFPIFMGLRKHAEWYTGELEKSGRYPLCLWPPHCIIGSRGNTILPVLNDAIMEWVAVRKQNPKYVSKGSNVRTEHYSAVKAEVPDPTDDNTQLNTRFIETLEEADELLIAGEASSHCVANTVRDIADGFSNQDYVKKMVLLMDGTSPVPQVGNGPDFPAIAEQFVAEMQARGMQTAKTSDFANVLV